MYFAREINRRNSDTGGNQTSVLYAPCGYKKSFHPKDMVLCIGGDKSGQTATVVRWRCWALRLRFADGTESNYDTKYVRKVKDVL